MLKKLIVAATALLLVSACGHDGDGKHHHVHHSGHNPEGHPHGHSSNHAHTTLGHHHHNDSKVEK